MAGISHMALQTAHFYGFSPLAARDLQNHDSFGKALKGSCFDIAPSSFLRNNQQKTAFEGITLKVLCHARRKPKSTTRPANESKARNKDDDKAQKIDKQQTHVHLKVCESDKQEQKRHTSLAGLDDDKWVPLLIVLAIAALVSDFYFINWRLKA